MDGFSFGEGIKEGLEAFLLGFFGMQVDSGDAFFDVGNELVLDLFLAYVENGEHFFRIHIKQNGAVLEKHSFSSVWALPDTFWLPMMMSLMGLNWAWTPKEERPSSNGWQIS